MARSIIIIGAGIGGLSAGCYAAMNGYNVRILESHARPGGLCTAWTRHGYTFDGCIHNLAGSTRESGFYPVFEELGILPATPMHAYRELIQVERPDGPPLTLYTDLDRLEAHLQTLFPKDGAATRELIADAKRFAHFDIMGLSARPWTERIGLIGALPLLVKYGRLTMDEFAKRFTDPFLRRVFPTLIYDWPQQSMLIFLTFLGRCSIGDLGWPMGGSGEFANRIAKRFHDLGGTIRYHAKAQSILVENGRAVGVKLADGTEERADIVVSNAYGHTTIFGMLNGRYTNPAIRDYYAHPEDRCEMGIHVSLGVARDLREEPHALILPFDKPIEIAGEMRDRFYLQLFGFDPSLAPKGGGVIRALFATSYRRWEELAADPTAYQAEKQRIADAVVAQLEPRFPGITRQVEAVDVATPITTQRFTGNAQGFKASVVAIFLGMIFGRTLSQTLPGLANFYMVGQWAGGGGVSGAAAMGRNVARAICNGDHRAFVTSKADVALSATERAKVAA